MKIVVYFENNDYIKFEGNSLTECLCDAVMFAEQHDTSVSGYMTLPYAKA